MGLESHPSLTSHITPAADMPAVFGMRFSALGVDQAAALMARRCAPQHQPALIFVTPNIQHIAEMRSSGALRWAMAGADLITCDGFPVARYARLRGCRIPGRVTGREVVAHLMRDRDLLAGHRLFFLVDGRETADAVRDWARRPENRVSCSIEIAPQGFGTDNEYCDRLAARIAAFGATMCFLCVGAPRSELFAAKYRDVIRDCWMLCIGQSVRVALGVNREPPEAVVRLHAEWAWRLWCEPKRLFARYALGTVGFGLAVMQDIARSMTGKRSPQSASKLNLMSSKMLFQREDTAPTNRELSR